MRLLLTWCLTASSLILCAQNFTISGRISGDHGVPVEEVLITLEGSDKIAHPNANGVYTITDVTNGSYFLSFELNGEVFTVKQVEVNGADVTVEDIALSNDVADDETGKQESSTITVINANDFESDAESSPNVSSVLSASRDAFTSAAAFSWGAYRFRVRGYDSEYSNVYLNGLLMNEVESGYARFSNWGGLNDVMRNRDNSIGLELGPYGFGGVGGYATIDTRASKQRKQTRFSYALSNRDYMHRVMASYSSGLTEKNWAFTAAGSMRYSKEGYVDGTFYRGGSFFLGVDKKIKDHLLSLTALGAPTMRGRSSTAIQEVYDITDDHHYNSYWGYQNGEKRNSSVASNFQPLIMLTHEWNKPNKMNWLTTVGVQFGRNALTALDWYDARDPRPDYYGYLPSYYSDRDSVLQSELYDFLSANPGLMQINWDALYEANRNAFDSVENANGIQGNTVYGKKAKYLIEERRTDVMRIGLNSVYDRFLNDNISFTAGAGYQFEKSNYYKVVDDLLGADFHLDINKYAIEEFPDDSSAAQNDLNNPNRIVKKGDRYGYDYDNNFNRVNAFGQVNFTYSRVDFFAGLELSLTNFWRTGNVRNGEFPTTSEGKSEVFNYFNYSAKAGVTYKINGRNYLYANGLYQTRAPQFRDVFVSPRTRNQAVAADDEKIYSAEAGYILRSPNVRFKASFFYTQFLDQTKTLSFFHDDLETFVNYTLTGIDKQHLGGEIALEYKILPSLTLSAVAAVGQYIYTDRPTATITQDNNSEVLVQNETIYLENYYVGGMPQNAYSLGLNYRSPKFWFASLTANYAHKYWVDPSPARHSQSAVDVVEYGSDQWNSILSQEELNGEFTLDFFGGYSWKLNNTFKKMKNNYFIYLTVGVNNITNNKDIVNNAFEQLRFDFEDKDPNKFPTKYSYAYGINYFLNLAFRM